MEGLTKQQLILLALLVSFVTSMATGIVTVSLMDQAPKTVTQTINRVVERTIEKVVPAENSAAVVTKETVVVKADDLVISAVQKNSQSVLRIYRVRDEYGVEKKKFGSLGVVVSKKGLIAADIGLLQKEVDIYGSVIPESYEAVSASGNKFQVVPVGVDDTNNISFFETKGADDKTTAELKNNVVKFADSDSLKLGQTVIAIGGADDNSISTGIISSLEAKDQGSKIPGSFDLIKTDLRSAEIVSGTILLNLSGELSGMMAGKNSSKGNFLPARVIADAAVKIENASRASSSTAVPGF